MLLQKVGTHVFSSTRQINPYRMVIGFWHINPCSLVSFNSGGSSCLSSFIWTMHGTITGTNIPSQSGPGSNGNEGLLSIPQSSWAVTSPSDGLMSYSGHSLGVGLTPLPRFSRRILQLQLTGLIYIYIYIYMRVPMRGYVAL